MKITELLQERKIHYTSRMYHGTSSKYLRSILKNGLLPFTGQAGYGSVDFPSLGGVYLTSRQVVAKHAALESSELTGSEPIIVVVQYVDRSGTADEDDIFNDLIRIGVTDYAANLGEIRMNPLLYKATQSISDVASFTNTVNRYLSVFYQELFKLLDDITLEEITKTITAHRTGVLVEQLMGNVTLRAIMTNILNSTRAKASQNKEVRVTRPIKFKGGTRILEIYHLRTGQVYYRAQ